MSLRQFRPVVLPSLGIAAAGALLLIGLVVSRSDSLRTISAQQAAKVYGGMCSYHDLEIIDTACENGIYPVCDDTQAATCQHCGGTCDDAEVWGPGSAGSWFSKWGTANCPSFQPTPNTYCNWPTAPCDCISGDPNNNPMPPSCGSYPTYVLCPV